MPIQARTLRKLKSPPLDADDAFFAASASLVSASDTSPPPLAIVRFGRGF
jgi:hypothetical protein